MCDRAGTPSGQKGLQELRAPHNTKTAEDVCGKCSFLSTKPGSIPHHIALLIGEALRLDTLKRAGATFAYPDALPPALWTALEVLEIARAKDQEKDFQEQKKGDAQVSAQKALEARLAKG